MSRFQSGSPEWAPTGVNVTAPSPTSTDLNTILRSLHEHQIPKRVQDRRRPEEVAAKTRDYRDAGDWGRVAWLVRLAAHEGKP